MCCCVEVLVSTSFLKMGRYFCIFCTVLAAMFPFNFGVGKHDVFGDGVCCVVV